MAELNDHSARAHALLSASSSSRWLMCPPSAMAAELYPATDTAFTREGTKAHEVAEARARGAEVNVSDDPEITAEMIRCADAYADYIQELVHDDAAVVLLEQQVDFSPWVPGGFGTCDCLILQGNRLDVIDYKYGAGVAVSAEGNSQMRLYALGAWHDFGDIYGIEEIVMHIFQPRMNNISADTLPARDLLDWGAAVKPTAERAAKGEGDMCSGEHCRFCPHAGSCPRLAADCMQVVNNHGAPVPVPSLLPWQVADILRAEPMVSSWLKAVKDRALSGMMNGEEIPGYKVVEGRSTRKWGEASHVRAILEGADYDEDWYLETKLLSPAQLEKSIGKKKVAELVGSLIVSEPGSPTVAPESDKRKPFNRLEASRKAFE